MRRPGPVGSRRECATSHPASAGAVGGDRIRLVAAAGDEEVVLAELDGRYWTFEVAKSFTGRVVGLYAAQGTVTFADLRYRGGDAAEAP